MTEITVTFSVSDDDLKVGWDGSTDELAGSVRARLGVIPDDNGGEVVTHFLDVTVA